MPFKGFSEPVGDWTYSAQLQEWADHFGVTLRWRETPVRRPNGSTENQLTPTINGRTYEDFSASDAKKQMAKNKSAGLVISSGLPDRILRSQA
ncbi:hypothetical protein FRC07_005426 [Ceratobasidium sp. 392]|nr:hypothetical protein FRC07_005426 [Ceratobasidium sp. 392]